MAKEDVETIETQKTLVTRIKDFLLPDPPKQKVSQNPIQQHLNKIDQAVKDAEEGR